jgi:hypothetical protein
MDRRILLTRAAAATLGLTLTRAVVQAQPAGKVVSRRELAINLRIARELGLTIPADPAETRRPRHRVGGPRWLAERASGPGGTLRIKAAR